MLLNQSDSNASKANETVRDQANSDGLVEINKVHELHAATSTASMFP